MTYPDIPTALARERSATFLAEAAATRRAVNGRARRPPRRRPWPLLRTLTRSRHGFAGRRRPSVPASQQC